MLFVVTHHFICHALCPDVLTADNRNPLFIFSSFWEGFVFVGVNCFLLISGYFGIRLKARRVWLLYLQCAFYGLIGFLLAHFYSDLPLTHTIITKTVFIFSHPLWWFVAYYLLLMIISPILNAGTESLTKKGFIAVLAGITFVQVYLGFFWQKSAFDPHGYSILNFVYLYLIGRYIHLHGEASEKGKMRLSWLMVYFACALLFGVCNILRTFTDIPFGFNYSYNNPLVILASIGLFQFINSISFHSNTINYLAGGVFAAYLLQDQVFIAKPLYGWWAAVCNSLPSFFGILLTFTLSVAFIFLSVLIEKGREKIMKPLFPIFDFIDSYFESN